MKSETLFVTVGLIDKYLAVVTDVSSKQLSCLGVAAILIAGKYEEIYPPDLKTILKVTNNIVSREDVLQMENQILMTL
jgi:hypothetical protein